MTQSGSLSFDSYGLADYFVITDDAADPQLQQRGFRNPYRQRLPTRMHLSNWKAVESFEVIMSTDIVLPMIGLFTKNWWVLLLRGIVAVLFGILAITRPGITLAVLVLLFGIYAVVDGYFALFAAIGGWSHREDRWLLLLEGFIGIGAGILTLRAPGITTVALLFFVAAWALATGVLRIVAAIRLRKEITGEFWLALSGIASVVFAFLVMMNPAAGALAIAWLIGWYALFLGATLVMLSIKLHKMRRLGDMPRGTYERAA
jgi:uncharacterized membrane protein HdeD (DUF308 family)